MKISTQTRYAVRILAEVAMNSTDEKKVTAQEIAISQGISEKYLESIATKLRKIGMLESSKGFHGGYKLAMRPCDITLGLIMRKMETTFFQVHCIENPEVNCKCYNSCTHINHYNNIEKAIIDVVDNITLESMLT